jgi:hypothetical protein
VYLEVFDFVHTTPGSINYLTHRWANAFFDYLHERQWSSKLTALVVHCSVLKHPYSEPRDGYDFTPQHCYIKGFETDMLGRCRAVGVPVSRATLRKAEPYADILDWDPECNWVGGLPGRFTDTWISERKDRDA